MEINFGAQWDHCYNLRKLRTKVVKLMGFCEVTEDEVLRIVHRFKSTTSNDIYGLNVLMKAIIRIIIISLFIDLSRFFLFFLRSSGLRSV